MSSWNSEHNLGSDHSCWEESWTHLNAERVVLVEWVDGLGKCSSLKQSIESITFLRQPDQCTDSSTQSIKTEKPATRTLKTATGLSWLQAMHASQATGDTQHRDGSTQKLAMGVTWALGFSCTYTEIAIPHLCCGFGTLLDLSAKSKSYVTSNAFKWVNLVLKH